jgi:hypothetical protein
MIPGAWIAASSASAVAAKSRIQVRANGANLQQLGDFWLETRLEPFGKSWTRRINQGMI